MKIEPQTYRKLTQLRNKLQQITQISFNYSMINRNYPFESLDEKQAQEVIKMYKDCLDEFKNLKLKDEKI